MTGKIAQIETMGLVDGPGVRVVIFMQGCPLRCVFCHNPEMWTKDDGKEYTSKEIVNIILKYKSYFGEDGGVTFSGGEPLFQSKFLIECLKLCKENDINTCIDTSGAGDSKYFDEVLKYTDLILYSIKGFNEEEYKNTALGSIDSSLKFLDACQRNNKPLWIRYVVIPDVNDDEEHMIKLAEYIKTIKNVQKVELLPYHTMGVSKYKNLNIKYELENTKALDSKKLEELTQIFNKEYSRNNQ